MENRSKIAVWLILGALAIGYLIVANKPQTEVSNQKFAPSNTAGVSIPLVEDEDCIIKGNISYKTGEKIYHLPSDAYYSKTVINEAYGEHWFCTEAEARAAGWRHSYR